MSALNNELVPTGRRNSRSFSTGREKGTLVISLVMLIAISLLGIAAAQMALQGEKTSRNDRDRQIAFHAAEAALADAEADIESSPDTTRSRSHIFSKNSALGFPDTAEDACQNGASNRYLGLCRSKSDDTPSVWRRVDFLMSEPEKVHSVPYGMFTGKTFPVAKGSLPNRLPRYIIELLPYAGPGENASNISYLYRITAIGFGARETTQVVLQTFYRKEE